MGVKVMGVFIFKREGLLEISMEAMDDMPKKTRRQVVTSECTVLSDH